MSSTYCILAIFIFSFITATRLSEAGLIKHHVPHESPESRIVGGREAVPHSAPYAVFLRVADNQRNVFRCAGSLISEKYVLTAAHCLRGRIGAIVYLGAHNISRTEESQVKYTVLRSSFKIHPYADIGLIELPESAPINAYIKTIDLPSKSDVDRDYSYRIGVAHGWGVIQDEPLVVANVLYTVRVMVSPQSQCIGSSDEICTSGSGGKGTCNGDSGGPLVVGDELIGITAWGPEKCEIGDPSVYTSVNKYLSWIENNSDVKIRQLVQFYHLNKK